MAEVTARRMGELVRGVFKILLDVPQGLPAREVLSRLAGEVPPTPFEDSTYPKYPKLRRFENIVRFATVTVVKAGWLVKDGGQWTLTEEGRRGYKKHKDPEDFYREARRLYQEWKKDQPDEEAGDDGQTSEEDEDLVAEVSTLEEVEETAWAQVVDRLGSMPWLDFQRLVAGLLQGMGYHVAWEAPPGPDKGIDIIAHSDPLGVNGPRIKAQVKRRTDPVDLDGVKSFLASLEDGDIGVYVAKGGFTKSADEEARRSRRRLMLIDAKRLFDLWIEHYDRIPEERRRLLPLRAVYFLLPSK